MKNRLRSDFESRTRVVLTLLAAALVIGSASVASAESHESDGAEMEESSEMDDSSEAEESGYMDDSSDTEEADGHAHASEDHGSECCSDCCGHHGMMGGKYDSDAPPHTEGPYFRGGFGAGFASHHIVNDFNDDTFKTGEYSTFSLSYEAVIGGFIAKNTALHASFFGNVMPKPVEREGNYGIGDAERFNLMAFGMGLTNYFGQSGFLFSVSPGAARLHAQIDTGGFAVSGKTDWGFAFDSMLAYEWRMSEKMSVGTGVGGQFYVIPDADIGSAQRRGYHVGGRFFIAWD